MTIPDSNLIPSHMRHGIIEYILFGAPMGGFLKAVFENNLTEAVARADHLNMWTLPHYASFLFNIAPGGCWGSAEKIAKWTEARKEHKLLPEMVAWPHEFKGDVKLLWDIYKTPAPSEA